MTRSSSLGLAALVLLALPWGPARAGVYIGVGVPGPYYRPHHRHYDYGPRVYVAPPAVVIRPAPVYVAPTPAPVYVQPAPTVLQVPATPATSPLPPAPAPVPAN